MLELRSACFHPSVLNGMVQLQRVILEDYGQLPVEAVMTSLPIGPASQEPS